MTELQHKPFAARGFSLLETLVALSILAAALGAIFSIFSTALRAAAEADAVTQAARAGEALLGSLGAELPLREGVSSGALNGALRWRITITAFLPDAELASWQMPLRGYWVEMEIDWQDAGRPRAVRLATLRLTPDRELAL